MTPKGARLALPAALVLLAAAGCGERPGGTGASPADPSPPHGLEFVPPEPGTYELPPIQPAADGDVLDTSGEAHRLFDVFGDHYVVLSFIFSRCHEPEGCPLAWATLARLHRRLGEDPELSGRVRLVSLSFDPAHDTPRVMAAYAEEGGLDPGPTGSDPGSWVVLTTASREDLAPILDGYGQLVVPEVDERGRPTGTFSHMLKVFLIDPQRRVRNVYGADFLHPEIVANDLKTLVRAAPPVPRSPIPRSDARGRPSASALLSTLQGGSR